MLGILPPTLNLIGALLLAAFVLWDEQRVDRFLSACRRLSRGYLVDVFGEEKPTARIIGRIAALYVVGLAVLVGALALAASLRSGKAGAAEVVLVLLFMLFIVSFAFSAVALAGYLVADYANHDRERERRVGVIGAALLCLGYVIDIWLRI